MDFNRAEIYGHFKTDNSLADYKVCGNLFKIDDLGWFITNPSVESF